MNDGYLRKNAEGKEVTEEVMSRETKKRSTLDDPCLECYFDWKDYCDYDRRLSCLESFRQKGRKGDVKSNYIMKGKEVTFEVIKDIYWDNWGHLTKVFKKGDICKGSQYPTDVVVAESPYYKGVSDVVDLEHINIIKD